ncbi:MAG: YeeE/YedE family protein [Candidatus Krumholzibacteriota bacterium]|nr:YeeE/YedE family protein [Candidatus Krumholzibacteriota bacterium]
MSFPLFLTIGFLFGVGFGFFVQRAGFCVAHGLGEIFSGRGRRFLRLLLIVFAITSVGFLLSGKIRPELGLKAVGQIRGAGFYNILSGVLFGMGILMTGGCILGTLRQLGEGNLNYLVVLAAFAPGMALVVYGLNPLLASGYQVQQLLLPDLLGVGAPWVTAALAAAAVAWYVRIRPRRLRWQRVDAPPVLAAHSGEERGTRRDAIARTPATAPPADEVLVPAGAAEEKHPRTP